MAEGFANYYGKGWLTAYSAGSRPLGFIMKNTILAMQEKGIDISQQTCKAVSTIDLRWIDWVIILDPSLGDCVRVSSRRTEKLQWSIPDPIGQPLDAYRAVRDQIELNILDFIDSIQKSG
jgi:arsenate reductase